MRCLTQQVIYGIKSSAYANIDISSPHKFYFKDLTITKSKNLKPLPVFDAATLGFGLNDTDHMLVVKSNVKTGWGKPVIKPLAPL